MPCSHPKHLANMNDDDDDIAIEFWAYRTTNQTSAGLERRASGGVVVLRDSKRICDLKLRVPVYSLAFSGQGSSNILDGCVICTICVERE
jgi:hypothetical protein